jgi:hypothetical protein
VQVAGSGHLCADLDSCDVLDIAVEELNERAMHTVS